MFKTLKKQSGRVIIGGMICLLLAGCALFQKTPPAKVPRQQHVDIKAQQHYYDIGLQQYSKENYGAAKKAFETVLENGPTTSLGIKAQENLKKIQRILKTLDEIESK